MGTVSRAQSPGRPVIAAAFLFLLPTFRSPLLALKAAAANLLSWIREGWIATLGNHVFLSFLLSTNVVVKMLALGLG